MIIYSLESQCELPELKIQTQTQEKCGFFLLIAALKLQSCHFGWAIYKWGQLNSIISCLFCQSLGKNDTASFLGEGT